MSTTVSRLDAASDTSGFDVAQDRGRRGRSFLVPLVVVLAAVAGAAGLWSWLGGGDTSGIESDLFGVVPRSFPVLLREKGELKAAKSVDIKSKVEGRSTIIWLIAEGTEVKKGDLLVKLASDQIDEKVRNEEIRETNADAGAAAAEKAHEILIDQNASDLRKAELALEMALIEKEKYCKGDWEQTKLDLQLELKRADKVLERTESELAASRELHAKEFITDGEFYRDQLAELEARSAVQKAKLNKETIEKYTHPKELAQRTSDVEEARKELERVKKSTAAQQAKSEAELDAKRAELALIRDRLAKFREQQASCEIKAPQGGLVVYETGGRRWDRRQIAEGAEVYERQTIIKLPDPSVMVVTVRIHEAKTDRIAIGQEVTVEVEGLPGQTFIGKVTKIATLADSQNMWLNPELKEYETEITLEQTDAPLKPGVTARADIVVTRLEDVLAVPVQAVFTKAGHQFVFRREGRDFEPVEVGIGASSDELVEITSGLVRDDQILLAVTDALRQKLPELKPPARPDAEQAARAKGPPGGGRRRPGPGHARRGGRTGRTGSAGKTGAK